jgi:hypothetical protein
MRDFAWKIKGQQSHKAYEISMYRIVDIFSDSKILFMFLPDETVIVQLI